MSKEELQSLIAQGEGYNLEFKESLSDNLGKDICAFANASGGKILIGTKNSSLALPVRLVCLLPPTPGKV